MSHRTEVLLTAGLVLLLGLAYLAAGIFFAQLAGLTEYSLAWCIFVAGWPAPLSVGVLVGWFMLSIAASVARAIVR